MTNYLLFIAGIGVALLFIKGVEYLQKRFFLPKDTLLFTRKGYVVLVVIIIVCSISSYYQNGETNWFYLYVLIPFLLKPHVYFTESRYVNVGLIKKQIFDYEDIKQFLIFTEECDNGICLNYKIHFGDGSKVALFVFEGSKRGMRTDYSSSSKELAALDEIVQKFAKEKSYIRYSKEDFEKLSSECKNIIKVHEQCSFLA